MLDANPMRTRAWRLVGAGIVLALAGVVTAITCGYYGASAALMVGLAVLFFTFSRGLWRNPQFWTAIATTGVVALALGFLFYLPYLELRN